MRSKIITSYTCFVLIVIVFAGFFVPDRYYSEREKRTLTPKPDFSITQFLSGKFGEDLESYLTDQIPLRDSWISLKTYAELAMGKRESGGVYIGKDNYLLDKFSGYSAKQFRANSESLVKLAQSLKENDIQMEVLLVPSSAQVLTDKLPRFAPVADYETMVEDLSNLGLSALDLRQALRRHSNESIYYRTDHHWTSLGAYYAYAAWRESKGLKTAPLSDWTEEILCDNFYGTTWNKVPLSSVPADTITAYYHRANRIVNYNRGNYVTDNIYEQKYLKGKDQYGVFFNSNQAITVVEGSTENGKLLIIKDSFANTFAQFVLDDYAEVHMIDLRFFHEDIAQYAADNGITEVLVLYGAQGFVSGKL